MKQIYKLLLSRILQKSAINYRIKNVFIELYKVQYIYHTSYNSFINVQLMRILPLIIIVAIINDTHKTLIFKELKQFVLSFSFT